MDHLSFDPVLGHINTFGGHPVSCAAGLAALQVAQEEKVVSRVFEKEMIFRNNLQHPKIEKINSKGLMMALHFDSYETNKKIIDKLILEGVFTDWFLFAAHALRIAPPLNISDDEIDMACNKILQVLQEV
jgi:acetylornithine/succinyldiaminopimelate/putrescine aminotransferase